MDVGECTNVGEELPVATFRLITANIVGLIYTYNTITGYIYYGGEIEY